MTTTNWGEIQASFDTQTLGIGALSDTEMTLSARYVLNRMSRKGQYWFQVESINLAVGSGVTSFDLATNLPGFKKMLFIGYDRDGITQPLIYLERKRFNARPDGSGDWYTIDGKTLYIKTTGTLTELAIDYIDSRMVIDGTTSAKKLTPENDNDVFVFPEPWVDVLTMGMEWRLMRREKQYAAAFQDIKSDFEAELKDLHLKETTPVVRPRRGLGDHGRPDAL